MLKEQKVDELFNVLVQFEKIDMDAQVSEFTYKAYLDRLHTWFLGHGDDEIVGDLEGLYALGKNAKHESVKRAVFHMISVWIKEMEEGDNGL